MNNGLVIKNIGEFQEVIDELKTSLNNLNNIFDRQNNNVTRINQTEVWSGSAAKSFHDKYVQLNKNYPQIAYSLDLYIKFLEKTLEDYKKAYGDDTYGLTAYILNKVQIYSIPFCFIGITISAIYQYVLGIRKLDTRDKGFAIMISIITIFVIAQVLPLIFAIVVKGWRG